MVAGGVDYRPWESPGLGDDDCFLCDIALDDLSRTLEDVFPWLTLTARLASYPSFTGAYRCRSPDGGHRSRSSSLIARPRRRLDSGIRWRDSEGSPNLDLDTHQRLALPRFIEVKARPQFDIDVLVGFGIGAAPLDPHWRENANHEPQVAMSTQAKKKRSPGAERPRDPFASSSRDRRLLRSPRRADRPTHLAGAPRRHVKRRSVQPETD